MALGRLKDLVFGPVALYPSTVSYIAWALRFAPALVLSCFYVGRNTLGLGNTDWVPFFGTVYFGLQAGFEEFMWRRAEKKR